MISPEAISLEDISKILKFCGVRDRAILLILLDTGLKAMELLDLGYSDIGITSGEILIRLGKGCKPHTVYLGAKSRKALRTYLKNGQDNNLTLWVSSAGNRLTYIGLRSIIYRRAKQAGLSTPSILSFRRAFAISMLRSGVDLIPLANLMGHTSLSVLQRDLKQTNEDTRVAHRLASPMDIGL